MQTKSRKGGMLYVIALALFLALGVSVGALPSGASPVALQRSDPEIGLIYALALDDTGNGWAWASPKPQTFATHFLLRIENGSWRIAADSISNPTLLPPGAGIDHIVTSGRGDSGWAVGRREGSGADGYKPFMWRFQNGAWRVNQTSFPDDSAIQDITLSADGTDGWMTLFDRQETIYRLLRLRNGAWNYTPGPVDSLLWNVAISPDGRSGWGAGINRKKDRITLFQLADGRWTEPAGSVSLDDLPAQLVADNAGNGWMLSEISIPDGPAVAQRLAPHAGYSEEMRGRGTRAQQPAGVLRLHSLYRLTRGAPPRAVPVAAPVPVQDPELEGDNVFSLNALSVDGLGRGWVAGSLRLGSVGEPGGVKEYYETILVRLRNDTAIVVPPESVGLSKGLDVNPSTLDSSPDGGHAWLGSHTGDNFGRLAELREPWSHSTPPAAAPLAGPALCGSQAPYCLRGAFARYWTEKGGLDKFGFPITPEVRETQGGKTYVVQYTERARLEYHPEFAGTPNEVLLGLLGNTLVEGRLNEAPFKVTTASGAPGSQWFKETGHNVGSPFLAYWQSNGGLPVYGLPRSEAFDERNAADGKTYRVQYFERNRLEYHPENRGTRFEMLLGLLGAEQFAKTYGYTP